ncbi:MAG: glycerate kinase type-2 family protein [Promethearchaeota archaeon]
MRNFDKTNKFNDLLLIANIENYPELPLNLRNLRELGLRSLIAGLNSVLPQNLLHSYIKFSKDYLNIGSDKIKLNTIDQVVIIGGGKATGTMAKALVKILADRIPFQGEINIPKGQNIPERIFSPNKSSYVHVNFATHPVPDIFGEKGVASMLKLLQSFPNTVKILALVLISGGGSSLMPYPVQGLSLDELQTVNGLLLSCGAPIEEMNCVRKHISAIKGGQLAREIAPHRAYTLILSDVIGNDFQTIASGPTVPDITTFNQAVDICQRYKIWNKLPESVRNHLNQGLKGDIPETPKSSDIAFSSMMNILIGSARTSIEIVKETLESEGVKCAIFTDNLRGEARDFGFELVHQIPVIFKNVFKGNASPHETFALLGTGEFTVSIHGSGIGGRNQEMLLGFLLKLEKEPKLPEIFDFTIISCAFDGIEGNSPAMGAIIDSNSLKRAKIQNINLSEELNNNNSFECFSKLKDALITGQTGTNVNDHLIILLKLKK